MLLLVTVVVVLEGGVAVVVVVDDVKVVVLMGADMLVLEVDELVCAEPLVEDEFVDDPDPVVKVVDDDDVVLDEEVIG